MVTTNSHMKVTRLQRMVLLILIGVALLFPGFFGFPGSGSLAPAYAQTTVGVKFSGDPRPQADGQVESIVSVLGQDGFPLPNLADLSKDNAKINVAEDNSPVSDFSIVPDSSPSAIVIMIDTSQAMHAAGPNTSGSGTPLEGAKEAAKTFVLNGTKPNDEVAIGTFTDGWEVKPWSRDQIQTVNNLSEVTGSDPGHGTCLYDAMYRAIEHVNTNSNPQVFSRAVVIITNGKDVKPGQTRCSLRNPQQVIDKANESHVPFYIIGIGQGVDITTLDDIARATDGKFALADNSGHSELERSFDQVERRLGGHYKLTYTSRASSGSHLLRIEVCPASLGCLSGEKAFYMPPIVPPIKAVKFDPATQEGGVNVLQGHVRISPQVDVPGRVGKMEYIIKGPAGTITHTSTGAAPDWDWDSAELLAGQSLVSATLEVRAYDTAIKESSKLQVPLTVRALPQPLPTTQFVLLGIGIAVIATLLLTLFMFLNRGRIGAAVARKPASVTKGEPLAQLLIVESPGLTKQQEHFLYGDRSVSIGRDEDQAIALPGERVSRSHGEIIYRRNQFFYNDIKATNGTAVDGQPVPNGAPVPLRDGSEIMFGGQTRAVFRLRPAGTAVAAGNYQPAATSANIPRNLPRVSQAELRTTEWVRETPLNNSGQPYGSANGGSPPAAAGSGYPPVAEPAAQPTQYSNGTAKWDGSGDRR